MENVAVVWVCPACESEIPFGYVVAKPRWFRRGVKTKLHFESHDIVAHIWMHEA